MEKEQMTRSEMLERLIDDEIEALGNEGANQVELYLREVLAKGIIGYNFMSEREFIDYYQFKYGEEVELIPE